MFVIKKIKLDIYTGDNVAIGVYESGWLDFKDKKFKRILTILFFGLVIKLYTTSIFKEI